MRILIVDDSPIMARMVARSLSLSGITLGDVYEASDVPEALSLLRAVRIDVVVADASAPVAFTGEMLERLSTDPSLGRPSVIMISGGQRECFEREMSARAAQGALAYVRRPFTPELFHAALRDVLGDRQAS